VAVSRVSTGGRKPAEEGQTSFPAGFKIVFGSGGGNRAVGRQAGR